MELGRGYEAKNGRKMKYMHGERIALNPDTVFVIKIPEAQVLHIMSRSLFSAMVLLTLPFLGSILRGSSSGSHSIVSEFDSTSASISVELLNFLLHDLADEGLLRKDDKALIVSPPHGFGGAIPFNNNEIDVVVDSDLERRISSPYESYDFVFISSSEDAKFVDRILKTDGIVALPLTTNPSNAFKEKANYTVVYLRRYSYIIVALRKNGSSNKQVEFSTERKLCKWASQAKKVALKGLEDVLLEPPKAKSKHLKKIKYLPDLMGDSLEGYKRRVFIGVGLPEENRGAIKWFKQNYPESQKFEIYSLPIVSKYQFVPQTDVSVWLSKHVKEKEYVVMKAEAEVVEEMIKERTICIVDELFLECKNEWWKSGKRRKIGRAYWECLALYGRLRDEGVAVHQWWG